MPSGFFLEENSLNVGLAKFPAVIQGRVGALMEYQAQRGQNYMRQNAPWTDRSGNARQGLFAKVTKGIGSSAIDFYHTVPYGIWLELANGRRYQIIEPTIKKIGSELMPMLKKVLG